MTRTFPAKLVTMPVDMWERLDEMAARWGVARSAAMARLVREADLPKRVGTGRPDEPFPFGPVHRHALEIVYAKNTAKGGGPAFVADVASEMRGATPLAVVASVLADLRRSGFVQRTAGGFETTAKGDVIATGDR